jgi:nucleotide-binding universal stress UspA family protein
MKILLAVDGSECSRAAAAEAARRPWPAGSEVKVISVYGVRLSPMAKPWLLPRNEGGILEARRQEALNIVKETAAELVSGSRGQLVIKQEAREGSPKQVILEEAEAWGTDLIILGSHGYGPCDRFLLGSVSNAVAAHARCSVEIVRRHKRD